MQDEVNPIYEERVLVFTEVADEGVFKQVLLNKDQFKKVSAAICVEIRDGDELKLGFQEAEVNISDKDIPIDTFIGMNSIDED